MLLAKQLGEIQSTNLLLFQFWQHDAFQAYLRLTKSDNALNRSSLRLLVFNLCIASGVGTQSILFKWPLLLDTYFASSF